MGAITRRRFAELAAATFGAVLFPYSGLAQQPQGTLDEDNSHIVIVDMQYNSFIGVQQDVRIDIIQNHLALIAYAKEHGIPVCIQEMRLPWEEDSGSLDTIREIRREVPDEHVFTKEYQDATYKAPRFAEYLSSLDRNIAIMTGFAQEKCVKNSSRGILNLDQEHTIAIARDLCLPYDINTDSFRKAEEFYRDHALVYETFTEMFSGLS